MTRPVSGALWESTPVPRSGMGLLIDPHLRTVNYDPITSFEPNRDARARTCAARKMLMQQNQPRLECCGAQTMAELVHLQPHRFGHRAEAMPPKPAAPAGRGRGGSGPIATKVQRSKMAPYARDLVRGTIVHDDEVASVVYFASASATPKRANISTAVPSALSFASDASSFFRMASSAFRAPRAVRTIHDGL